MTPSNNPAEVPADPTGIELTYSLQHLLIADRKIDGERVQEWHVSADIFGWADEQSEEGIDIHVGDVGIFIVDIGCGYDPLLGVDDIEGDASFVAQTIFDPATSDLHEDLEEQVEPIGTGVIILNHVRLAPEWRGRGIGVAIAGLAIQQLSRGCMLAATLPAPIPDSPGGPEDPPEAHEAAVAALAATWAKLGFKHYRDGVYVLPLGYKDFDEACEELVATATRD